MGFRFKAKKYKTFDGKRYTLFDACKSKSGAYKKARRHRSYPGRTARVLKIENGYAVYIRGK
jgi:hypothetical protein